MRAVICSLLLLAGAAQAAAPSGADIFAANCALCHQPDGAGAPGLAPALAGTLSRFAGTPGGRIYLSQILVSGMAGQIETQGHPFRGLMPSFADKLNDAEMAAVIGYVLGHFNAVPAPVVLPADVAAARARAPSATDTRHARLAALGAP